MTDPIDILRRAGYLDHFAGLSADDIPPLRDPSMVFAWLEGWRQRQSDTDAARRSVLEGRETVDLETLGATPAALPCTT